MKNITLAIEEEVYRQARILAAERETSVSKLVAEYLRGLTADGDTFRKRLAKERRLRKAVGRFQASDRLDRDELHRRRS